MAGYTRVLRSDRLIRLGTWDENHHAPIAFAIMEKSLAVSTGNKSQHMSVYIRRARRKLLFAQMCRDGLYV
jgi:hypothetical protein